MVARCFLRNFTIAKIEQPMQRHNTVLSILAAVLSYLPAEAGTPARPPLQPLDMAVLPPGVKRIDLFLLMGQSNMKGRGDIPVQSTLNPRIAMLHLRDDRWYLAQHPLHDTSDPVTRTGAEVNRSGKEVPSGVGPGLAFAEALAACEPDVMIGLIPCAQGGSPIQAWRNSSMLYDRALRRAKIALETTPHTQARLRGILWLQGESDSSKERALVYQERLLELVDDVRKDLQQPDLPFIACTIGSFIGRRWPQQFPEWTNWQSINEILLKLPSLRSHTGCVDAQDLVDGHIGDFVHYNTNAQQIIGRRFAETFRRMIIKPVPPPKDGVFKLDAEDAIGSAQPGPQGIGRHRSNLGRRLRLAFNSGLLKVFTEGLDRRNDAKIKSPAHKVYPDRYALAVLV